MYNAGSTLYNLAAWSTYLMVKMLHIQGLFSVPTWGICVRRFHSDEHFSASDGCRSLRRLGGASSTRRLEEEGGSEAWGHTKEGRHHFRSSKWRGDEEQAAAGEIPQSKRRRTSQSRGFRLEHWRDPEKIREAQPEDQERRRVEHGANVSGESDQACKDEEAAEQENI